jgi:hypothetical protein
MIVREVIRPSRDNGGPAPGSRMKRSGSSEHDPESIVAEVEAPFNSSPRFGKTLAL